MAIPAENLERAVPGGSHAPRHILTHVCAYDDLIVKRLRRARIGETTALDRDRTGWEAFNDRIWAEADHVTAGQALGKAAQAFLQLLEEVSLLSDAELNERRGITELIDPEWLGGRCLWELIGIDAFDHYGMHIAQLEAAAAP